MLLTTQRKKGQETYQIIGKEKHDFDERVVVYKHLNK